MFVKLRIVDVSDPTQPQEIGFVDSEGYSYRVTVSGEYAYLRDGANGLRIIDISNPYDPHETGFIETGHAAYGAIAENEIIYLIDSYTGLFVLHNDLLTPFSTSSIKNPMFFELTQNYPNPFNSSTIFTYSLPTNSDVDISIFNIIGELVEVLHSGNRDAGEYHVTWDASKYSSGTYFIRLKAGDFIQIKKCVLLK